VSGTKRFLTHLLSEPETNQGIGGQEPERPQIGDAVRMTTSEKTPTSQERLAGFDYFIGEVSGEANGLNAPVLTLLQVIADVGTPSTLPRNHGQ